MVEVLYFAKLKDITNKDWENFPSGEMMLIDLIFSLLKKYPTLKEILWNEQQYSLSSNVTLAINHKKISQINLQSFKLKETDKVAFLLPFSGG
ncbi:MAG: MoaD family protein [Candidatus Lokiarchaeota archaeon]